jgi:hypothetical protein
VVKKHRKPADHWRLTTVNWQTLAWLFVFVPVYLAPAMARAVDASQNIYVARAIVTGTDERDRPRGLAICLGQVLVNVSGDPNILTRPGVPSILARAESMTVSLDYFDRMGFLHKHDEQGTRDRPFTLTATFDPAKVGLALKALGETARNGPRPDVFLVIQVHGYTGNFVLDRGPATGYDTPELMRASINDAAWQYKLQVALPASAGAAPASGMMEVKGILTWSDADYGWIAAWGADGAHWSERGVSFDDAFRGALAGALAIASGHAPPLATR